ncbi:hypothetical protein B0J14DRAFT_597651 [Halenospora varia]|nr:hypothetical protein B0J14DRAFT_597651 [Halenospora varia]
MWRNLKSQVLLHWCLSGRLRLGLFLVVVVVVVGSEAKSVAPDIVSVHVSYQKVDDGKKNSKEMFEVVATVVVMQFLAM